MTDTYAAHCARDGRDDERSRAIAAVPDPALRALVAQANKRQKALIEIWGDDNYFNARSMDVFITKLRKYLKEDPTLDIINVHGKGFRLIDNAIR